MLVYKSQQIEKELNQFFKSDLTQSQIDEISKDLEFYWDVYGYRFGLITTLEKYKHLRK